MAYRQQLYISPTTLTDLTVTIEYDNQELPSKTLTLNDFSIVDDELNSGFTVLNNCTVTIQSQGYETKTLNINIEDLEDKHIVLTPLLDYFSKVSDGTDTYFVKAEVIKNQQNSSSLKYWFGTKAQYDAIATKDSDTIYNVEDTTSPIVDILNTLYPIGAIYIGTMATCPLSVLGVGTWQLVAQDRVLQGAGTRGAVGSEIDESLPNIRASINDYWNKTGLNPSSNSAIYFGPSSNKLPGTASSGGFTGLYFDASRSSSTYQDNAPVQQDGYLVNIWERVA
jgi:hypothetical protein